MVRKYGFVVKNKTTISDFKDYYESVITNFEIISDNCFMFHCNHYEYTALYSANGEVEGAKATRIHLKCDD